MVDSAPQDNSQTSKNTQTDWLKPFKHPLFNIICGLVTIISFLSAIYIYYATKTYPQLVGYIHPVKATIVKSGQTSEIKTVFKDKEITTDVTAAQVAIWNQGNTSIKKDQILKPIVISTQNNAPILEATIRNSTREEITNLKLNSDEFQNGRLTVSWNILEHNDGGTIQIVYAGDSQISLNFEGVIEGQNEIVSSNEDSNSKSIFHINTKPYWYYYLLIIFYISIGVFALDRPIKFMKRDILERDYRGVFLLSILMLVSLIMLTIAGLFIYNLFFSNNFTPPFELS